MSTYILSAKESQIAHPDYGIGKYDYLASWQGWGCVILLRGTKVKVLVTQSSPTLCDPTRLLCPWSSPGKNIGMGSHALLQGNFLTQGSKPGLLYCRQILSEPQGKPTLKKKEQTTGNNNATNHKCQNIPMWMKCPWSVKKQPVLPAADQLKRLRERKTHSKGFCDWLGIFQL